MVINLNGKRVFFHRFLLLDSVLDDAYRFCAMHCYLFVFAILSLHACVLPFAVREKVERPLQPPLLRVRFDSARAAAHLTWNRVSKRGFQRYEVQRREEGRFVSLTAVAALDDTSYVDERLQADVAYRYRVVSYFTDDQVERSLPSAVVEGGIHLYVDAWRLGPEKERFLPTRLAVDRRGVVAVVGAGRGWVARFDRYGDPRGDLLFTEQAPACLETGTLDGPSLALDSEDCLYVAYNVGRQGGGPQAYWSKYDPDGDLMWTRPLEALFARHIVIDAADRIFIESISQIQQFDRNGERQKQYLVPPLLVTSLRFWADKFAALIEPLSLVEGDWQAPRLVVYEGVERQSSILVLGRDPTSPLDQGNGLLKRPTDFVVDEESARSFVVNAGLSRVEVFREDRFLTRLGEEGESAGQFRFAGQAAVIDDIEKGTVGERPVVAGGIAKDAEGYLYVADTFNNRIQKFQP